MLTNKAFISTLLLCAVAVPSMAQELPAATRTSVAVITDSRDEAAAMLADALRDQIRRSARYMLSETSRGATVVVHLVGMPIPACRPASAVAVSYVSLPAEKHLGTAVLTTDRTRVASSAKETLARLPDMLSNR